jgi:hypothetical protein
MTTISTISDFLDELDELLETKDNPDEWYVVSGKQTGEYSIHTDEAPEEFDDSHLPPEEQDANENVDGFYQIGTQGWSAQAFDDDVEFVSEVGFSRTHDVIDRRINGLLLVHEDVLSEEALEIANSAEEVTA